GRPHLATAASPGLSVGRCGRGPLLVVGQSRHPSSGDVCGGGRTAPWVPTVHLPLPGARSPSASAGACVMSFADLTWTLPPELEDAVHARIADMRGRDVIRRIWDGDSSVWTSTDEDRWLGWLNLPTTERRSLDRLANFAAGLRRDGVTDVVLLG